MRIARFSSYFFSLYFTYQNLHDNSNKIEKRISIIIMNSDFNPDKFKVDQRKAGIVLRGGGKNGGRHLRIVHNMLAID